VKLNLYARSDKSQSTIQLNKQFTFGFLSTSGTNEAPTRKSTEPNSKMNLSVAIVAPLKIILN
jgi:hypothetical protein